MKVMIVSKFGHLGIKEVDHVPRIGEKVDVFYRPCPTVVDVVWWPDASLLNTEEKIDVLLTVD